MVAGDALKEIVCAYFYLVVLYPVLTMMISLFRLRTTRSRELLSI